ncbi:hypothetical protein Tco_0502708 [Tanacetum coccineum]
MLFSTSKSKMRTRVPVHRNQAKEPRHQHPLQPHSPWKKQDETQTGKEKCPAEEEGTTPPSYSTITDATKKNGETEIAQGKSAKRALFNQQSTNPKKQKGD